MNEGYFATEWRESKREFLRTTEGIGAIWKGLTKGDWARFKAMVREDFEEQKDIGRYVWESAKRYPAQTALQVGVLGLIGYAGWVGAGALPHHKHAENPSQGLPKVAEPAARPRLRNSQALSPERLQMRRSVSKQRGE